MADHLDLSKAPWHGRRPENQFYGYYIHFDATGNKAVDDVLRAVAAAAKAHHSTEWWADSCDGEPSYLDWIKAAVNAAAADNAALRERVAKLERVREAAAEYMGMTRPPHDGESCECVDAYEALCAALDAAAGGA